MKIFKSKHKLQNEILTEKNISFVPTMGGLHKGHLSLIKKSKTFKGKTIVSIFVNPDQFNKKSDYENYPRNIKKDLRILKSLKTDIVYIPRKKEILSFKPINKVYLDKFSSKLCGSFRKGHFKGVLNIVNRFLETIKPKRLILGVKDFQQLYLIKKHILKRKIHTQIVSCKTIREKNGIACSTRNSNLTKKQLRIASKIFNLLSYEKKKSFMKLDIIKKNIIKLGVKKIDYLEIYNLKSLKKTNNLNKNSRIFIAYYLDKIRLIDNI